MKKEPARTYFPPPDKSVTHRALMLAAIADGTTRVSNPSTCEDTLATAACLEKLGVRIKFSENTAEIKGAGLGGLKAPFHPLNAGESATTMRLLAGLLAGQKFGSVITGRGSLLKRPMDRVTRPLSAMGAKISSCGGFPPLKITGGRLLGAVHRPPAASAQVKSALLLAGLYAKGRTAVTERFRTRDHTERLMKYFGAHIRSSGPTTCLTPGPLKARGVKVPGDISSSAPFIAAACLLRGFTLSVKDTGLNPGRTGLIRTLKRMGAGITVNQKTSKPEPAGDIAICGSKLKGVRVNRADIPTMIDEIPLLALIATQALGTTVITGIGELRLKESDRVRGTCALLAALGLKATVRNGALAINGPQKVRGGGPVETFNDHRIAMAAAVGGLLAARPVKVMNAACVKKSYPDFFGDFKKVFAKARTCSP